MKKRSIFALVCAAIAGAAIAYFFPRVDLLMAITVMFAGAVIGFTLSGKQKRPEKKKADYAPEPEKRSARFEYSSEISFETYCLSQSDRPDKEIVPEKISEEVYGILFEPWNRGDMIFPAIDPLFKELLEKGDDPLLGKSIRQFRVKSMETDPFGYFCSFRKELKDLSLSAKEIMLYFVQNQDSHGESNWFVLNTEPEKTEIKESDLRMVDIKLIKDSGQKKYFIYCYRCGRWSILGGRLLERKSEFMVPVFGHERSYDKAKLQAAVS